MNQKVGDACLIPIYILKKKKENIKLVKAKVQRGFSKLSVRYAARVMRKGGFIILDDDHCTLPLTESEGKIKEKIYEYNQVFSARLTDTGVDTNIAEVKACKTEHTISDLFFQKLKGQDKKICPFADFCKLKAGKERALNFQ